MNGYSKHLYVIDIIGKSNNTFHISGPSISVGAVFVDRHSLNLFFEGYTEIQDMFSGIVTGDIQSLIEVNKIYFR